MPDPVAGLAIVYDDGGRHQAGHAGRVGDCAVRAVAIAAGRPYQLVHDELRRRGHRHPRRGVAITTLVPYLLDLGWRQVRAPVGPFTAARLPAGRVLVELAGDHPWDGHLVAVLDHVVHDVGEPRRGRARVLSVWSGPLCDQPIDDVAPTLW